MKKFIILAFLTLFNLPSFANWSNVEVHDHWASFLYCTEKGCQWSVGTSVNENKDYLFIMLESKDVFLPIITFNLKATNNSDVVENGMAKVSFDNGRVLNLDVLFNETKGQMVYQAMVIAINKDKDEMIRQMKKNNHMHLLLDRKGLKGSVQISFKCFSKAFNTAIKNATK